MNRRAVAASLRAEAYDAQAEYARKMAEAERLEAAELLEAPAADVAAPKPRRRKPRRVAPPGPTPSEFDRAQARRALRQCGFARKGAV